MLVIKGSQVLTGKGGSYGDRCCVIIDEESILDITTEDGLAKYPGITDTLDYPGATLIPGLVNTHCHLSMPGDGTSVEDAMSVPPETILLTAARNAAMALRSGVTTLADLGGPGRITFSLRDAIKRGVAQGPDLLLSGRPLTITGGHCWMFGGEADSESEIVAASRTLLKEGADLIKIMVTGGGTRGSNSLKVQFTQAQLELAALEAHRRHKPCFAHSSCIEAIEQVLAAQVDVVVHGHFNTPAGTLEYVPRLAEKAASQGTFWNPTLNVNRILVKRLAGAQGAADQRQRDARKRAYDMQVANFQRLISAGVRMVAGSDEGWGYNRFGTFSGELSAMAEAGMGLPDVLKCATSVAAEALGLSAIVGSIEPGKVANISVLAEDPSTDVLAYEHVQAVVLRGKLVHHSSP